MNIAGLERKVGQLTMELDLLKRGLASARRARGGASSVVSGPKPAASGPSSAAICAATRGTHCSQASRARLPAS